MVQVGAAALLVVVLGVVDGVVLGVVEGVVLGVVEGVVDGVVLGVVEGVVDGVVLTRVVVAGHVGVCVDVLVLVVPGLKVVDCRR